MKKILVILFILVFCVSLVFPAVYINEVELNPIGTDAGNEWVELYNSGNEINISGWYLQDRDGNNISLNVIIGKNNFYVADSLSGLVNGDENIKLFNNLGVLVDGTGNLSDGADDNDTWQRIPDGTGNFSFLPNTKGFPNKLTFISNFSSPVCVIEGQNADIGAIIDAFCIDEVLFGVTLIEDSFPFSFLSFLITKSFCSSSSRYPFICLWDRFALYIKCVGLMLPPFCRITANMSDMISIRLLFLAIFPYFYS